MGPGPQVPVPLIVKANSVGSDFISSPKSKILQAHCFGKARNLWTNCLAYASVIFRAAIDPRHKVELNCIRLAYTCQAATYTCKTHPHYLENMLKPHWLTRATPPEPLWFRGNRRGQVRGCRSCRRVKSPSPVPIWRQGKPSVSAPAP